MVNTVTTLNLPTNKIFLERHVKEECPEITLSHDLTALKVGNHLIPLLCDVCKEVNIIGSHKYASSRTVEKINVTNDNCFNCISCTTLFGLYKYFVLNGLSRLQLHCQWPGCPNIYSLQTLRDHEIVCNKQVQKNCFVDKCEWEGNLKHFMEHLQKLHSIIAIHSNKIEHKIPGTYYLVIAARFVIEVQYTRETLGEVYKHTVQLNFTDTNLHPVNLNFYLKYGKYIDPFQKEGSIISSLDSISIFVHLKDQTCSEQTVDSVNK